MGLLSKIKSVLGFGAASKAPESNPAAVSKGGKNQGKSRKSGRSRQNGNRQERAGGDRSQHRGGNHAGNGENRRDRGGPTRSHSAKPQGKGAAGSDSREVRNEAASVENTRPQAERTSREAADTGAEHTERRSRRNRRDRRDRGDRSDRPPRIMGPRDTPYGMRRPGGAFTPEQLKAYAAEHAAWDPASYVVPEEEGKKRFFEFDLPSEILHAVADLGFKYCSPIQAQSLEYALAGKNVAGRAQTGTGKTAAFLIAVLTRYLRTPERRHKPGAPRALILAPTRELVIQICKDAEALGKYCGDIRSLAVYGGMDYDRQRRELEDAPVDLLVATPGRLIDFVRSHIVDLRTVDTLVIDEADRMLDMGFIPDVRAIVNRLPDRDHRCTMLYSATLNETVMNLAAMWMRDPVRIEIEPEHTATETVKQIVYIARAEDKFTMLYNHLAKHPDARTLIFCNRKFTTERICDNLRRRGIDCDMLSGDVNQLKRLKILEAFRAGSIRTVVATDVAGRGIHVDDIAFVVNYDFPYEPEDYVHRIGRTGRAGHTGTAISFADEDESFIIPDIEKYINEPLKCTMPEEWMFAEIPAPAPLRKKRPGDRRRDRHEEAPVAEVPASEAVPVAEAAPAVTEAPAEVAPAVEEAPAEVAPVAEEAPAEVAPAEVASEVGAAPATEATSVAEVPVADVPATEAPAEAHVASVVSEPVEVKVDTETGTVTVTSASFPVTEAIPTAVAKFEKPETSVAKVEKSETAVTKFEKPETSVAKVETRETAPVAVASPKASDVQAEVPADSETAPEAPKSEGASAKKADGKRRADGKGSRGNRQGGRPEREPRFRPRGNGGEKARKDKQPRAPRRSKPVAQRWARTQADGPRDGSESHHAQAITARPIYTPGTRGPVSDEWSPGQN